MWFEFVARSGKDIGRTVALASGQALTVGRLPSCEVQLDDESVSRRHCTLHGGDDRCVVSDLQSANGTFVNDERVTSAELQRTDTLRIGSTVFELVAVEAQPVRSEAALASAFIRVTAEERGHTLVRKAVDRNRPEFLAHILADQDQQQAGAAAQRYLATLNRVSDRLSRAIGIEALFDTILDDLLEITGGDRAAILLAEDAEGIDERSEIKTVAVRATVGVQLRAALVLSRSVVSDVLENGMSTLTCDAAPDANRGAGDGVARRRARFVMCAPMRTPDRILGVLYADRDGSTSFSEAELELLAAVGGQAGVALHRARALVEVERLFIDLIRAISAIVDARDGYTHRHSERVAQFAVRIARQLGLAGEDRAIVQLSALLHDIGKIGVREAILNKPGPLTAGEFAEMKRHPAHGAEILGSIQSDRVLRLLPGVMYHHEKWDGSGYPDGRKGEDIPLIARIVSVAEFVDALSSDRSYRSAAPLDEVVALLKHLSGQSFDPAVVDAVAALHERGELALPAAPAPTLR